MWHMDGKETLRLLLSYPIKDEAIHVEIKVAASLVGC